MSACAITGGSLEVRFDGRENVPLGRRADAREVAYPILWLASDEASYVSGSVLMVYDGQFTK
jgi:2-hydroxycyclohexanecarboxyl-CoA dehydrogenase